MDMGYRNLFKYISILLIAPILIGCSNKSNSNTKTVDQSINIQDTYSKNDVTEFMSKGNSKSNEGDQILTDNTGNTGRYEEILAGAKESGKLITPGSSSVNEGRGEDNSVNIDNSGGSNSSSEQTPTQSEQGQIESEQGQIQPEQGQIKSEQTENIVYVNNVNKPKLYHMSSDCTKLITARSLRQMAKEDAIKLGVSACKTCCY